MDAWRKAGRQGVVEAVTGAGKTVVGIAAAAEAIGAGRRVLVLVPSIDLLDQWYEKFRSELRGTSIARLGDGHSGSLATASVLITTVQSATTPGRDRQVIPRTAGGLLIADECHRYGADSFQKALSEHFDWRLGLTATYGRDDHGNKLYLNPFFGGIRYTLRYKRAIRERVLAPFAVALLGVNLNRVERDAFDRFDRIAKDARLELINRYEVPAEPFGEFMNHVARLADGDGSAATYAARRYLKGFTGRREVLASSEAKVSMVRNLAPVLRTADRSIIFTQTIASSATSAAVLGACGLTAQAYTSDLNRPERQRLLRQFRNGTVKVLAAPRVLDEGVDVPEADIGVILAASRSQRQMVQRMGRILRPKPGDKRAIFLILYVKDSSEDPATGAHETFIEEITDVADEVIDISDAVVERERLYQFLGRYGRRIVGPSTRSSQPEARKFSGRHRVDLVTIGHADRRKTWKATCVCGWSSSDLEDQAAARAARDEHVAECAPRTRSAPTVRRAAEPDTLERVLERARSVGLMPPTNTKKLRQLAFHPAIATVVSLPSATLRAAAVACKEKSSTSVQSWLTECARLAR
ncbi:MAG: DEAD/DEAH box helicase [Chloroflexi bacterium]|nr:DEAD/DEAH box helicase [Chloroflexota bacterium]